jgi:hypothetical protein
MISDLAFLIFLLIKLKFVDKFDEILHRAKSKNEFIFYHKSEEERNIPFLTKNNILIRSL